GVPPAHHVGAGDHVAHRADSVRGQLHVRPKQLLSGSGCDALCLHRSRRGVGRDVGALLTLQQRPLCRHPVRRAHLLQPGLVRRPRLRHRRFEPFVDRDHSRSRSGRRRDLSPAAPLPHAVAGVVADDRPARRRLRPGARAARARSGDRRVTTSAIVAADHLSKWYGQVIGLNDVTLSVPSGITGLLGPNGAGKSTFMKLVTGQLMPSQGEITVLGEPIWQNPGLYFRLGCCHEQDAFYERMTGLEWVTALVRLNGVDEARATEMAHRALATVDLTDAAGKKIGAYSKGMRQRVKVAQALAHEPDLLILDEPLGGMDPIARRKTIRLIKDWGPP